MINKQSTRRYLVALLVLVGAAMIFLATEAWPGVLLVALGISIEAIGIATVSYTHLKRSMVLKLKVFGALIKCRWVK